MVGHIGQHRAQVLQVNQQKSLVVSHLEDDIQHAGLDVVEPHQARKQLRTHVGDGGAHRVALLAEYIEELHRAALELRVFNAEFRAALLDKAAHGAALADAGEVALHIGHETGNAGLAEGLGQHLQRDGFTGTGGTGNQAVAVGHLSTDGDGAVGAVRHV